MKRIISRRTLCVLIAVSFFGFLGLQLVRSYLPAMALSLQAEISKTIGADVSVTQAHLQLRPFPQIVLSGVTLTSHGSKSKIAGVDRVLLRFAILPLFKKNVVIENLVFQSPTASVEWLDNTISFPGVEAPTAQNEDASKEAVTETQPAAEHRWTVMLERMTIEDGIVNVKSAKGVTPVVLQRLSSSFNNTGNSMTLGTTHVQGSVGKLPFEIAAARATFYPTDSRIEIENGSVSLAGERLEISGTWGSSGGKASIATKDFALGKLRAYFPPGMLFDSVPLSEGRLTSDVVVTGTSSEAFRIEGSIRADRLKSPIFSLDSLRLEKFDADIGKGAIKKIRTNAALANLRVTKGESSYISESVEAKINYADRSKKETAATGEVAVRGFQYQDKAVHVYDVAAHYSDISLQVDAPGGVNVKGLLKGSSVRVKTSSVEVTQADNVSVPLEIVVPANGGYQVKGPVTVSGGAVVISDHVITGIDGSTSMLISGPLKQFQTSPINAVVNEKAIGLQTNFEMVPSKYEAKSVTVTLGGGTVKGGFSLSRAKPAILSARVTALKVAIEDAMKVLGIQGKDKMSGTVARFETTAKADIAALMETLDAKGSFEVTHGGDAADRFALKLIRAVAAIPIVGAPLRSKNEEAKGTAQKFQGDFVFQQQTIRSENVQFDLPSCSGRARGSVTTGGETAIKADIIFLRDSFTKMGMGFDRLGNLLGRAGKIEIPIIVSGKIPDTKIEPDLVQLAKNNSGLPLMKSAVEATRQLGRDVIGGVSGIVGLSGRKEESESQEAAN